MSRNLSHEQSFLTSLFPFPPISKAFSKINIFEALKRSGLSPTNIQALDRAMAVADRMLHALHVPEDDPNHLDSVTFLVLGDALERFLELAFGQKITTTYLHGLNCHDYE